MQSSAKCRDIIKIYEGFRDQTYKCSAGKNTIGYGCIVDKESDKAITIVLVNGSKKEYKKPLNKDIFNEMFNENVNIIDKQVYKIIGKNVKQSHFDAMVSLAFNIGLDAIAHSTALRELKNGNFEKAKNAIALWNKATIAGKRVELRGLTNRRRKEQAMFDGIYNV